MAGTVTSSSGTIAIVPARYASTRLPGKPLADVAGKPLIIRVLEGIGDSVHRKVVATDDGRIHDAVTSAGFEAVMTGPSDTGTERVFKAWEELGCPGDRIVNVQGDEPLFDQSWMEALLSIPPEDDLVVTLAVPESGRDESSPDSVSVVTGRMGEALYFSRYPVPHGSTAILHHLGVYCFSPGSLRRSVSAGSTHASRCERLEQLAWMENGLRIRVVEGEFQSIGVDSPSDLERAVCYYRKKR